ncbi:lipoxygenase [Fusarium flagelliforme]|uniref:Manganese lipoxygenase n=1 Tax=Fusarium flagelliforme TaxID=2675880 RepID=A0A395MRM6_9HYPO|nr:lipoxygenase [Fusarium flagelliforme]KAH7191718.1 lipoxygenase [Fusarium flagelliforme]RFN50614.1 lipoxygenase 1 [Fusarium flagelliforme]
MSTTASAPLQSKLDEILNSGINHKIEEDPMQVWDKGVFINELLKQGIALSTNDDGTIDGGLVANKGLEKGSYMGTRLALTEIYSILEDAAVSHFDSRGFEPIFPTQRDLDVKKGIYQWSDGSDGYPPHLKVQDNDGANLPKDERPSQNGDSDKPRSDGVGAIFDLAEVNLVQGIAGAVSFLIPKNIEHDGTPYQGPTIADVEKYNKANLPGADGTSNGTSSTSKSQNADIMKGRNIGEHDDWYSDARFAQQHFSGVNPSTIETAPADRIKAYIDEAKKQGLDKVQNLLENGKDLLIQDYSYFREATGVKNDQIFQNKIYELNGRTPTGKFTCRYAAASIVIFQLNEDGRLHPLAITLDYRGSLDDSITIFNSRLSPDEKGPVDEKEDWPWRYAKTVAQTADWARHEIASHLVDTHMIEEAIIVATNRTIPEDHLLYQVLSPHWFRTLALNAAARRLLVPGVIARVSGLGPSSPSLDTKGYAYGLVDWSYKNFNFQDKYIPNDLKKRGFDIEGEKGDKYRNYPYASSMYFLWGILRDFVRSVLETQYKSDEDVRSDVYIGTWCEEIQTQGQIKSFPTITTVDQLIDAVTMCIHTASPQHTAVNYLQDYYYSFVPSKPPALCTPLPQDLKALQGYTEKHLTDALPIGTEDAKWKDWLLAAQLPELLSFKVEDRYNLITYAKSLYNVNKDRTITENKKFKAAEIKDAAELLYSRLKDASLMFEYISAIQTKGTIEYPVLQPENTAISILI